MNDKGQSAIEYVLLVAAMAAILFSIMGYVKNKMVATDCAVNGDSLGCRIQGIYSTIGTNNNFRYFTIRR